MFHTSAPEQSTRTASEDTAPTDAVDTLATQLKTTAHAFMQAVSDVADETQSQLKAQAASLNQQLSNKIAQLTANESLSALTADVSSQAQQITAQMHAIKTQLTDEVSVTAAALKQQAIDRVQTKPLETLLLAAGAGLLIGYLVGTTRQP